MARPWLAERFLERCPDWRTAVLAVERHLAEKGALLDASSYPAPDDVYPAPDDAPPVGQIGEVVSERVDSEQGEITVPLGGALRMRMAARYLRAGSLRCGALVVVTARGADGAVVEPLEGECCDEVSSPDLGSPSSSADEQSVRRAAEGGGSDAVPYIAHALSITEGIPLSDERLFSLAWRINLRGTAAEVVPILMAIERTCGPGLLTRAPDQLSLPTNLQMETANIWRQILGSVVAPWEAFLVAFREASALIPIITAQPLPDYDEADARALVDELEVTLSGDLSALEETPELWIRAAGMATRLSNKQWLVERLLMVCPNREAGVAAVANALDSGRPLPQSLTVESESLGKPSFAVLELLRESQVATSDCDWLAAEASASRAQTAAREAGDRPGELAALEWLAVLKYEGGAAVPLEGLCRDWIALLPAEMLEPSAKAHYLVVYALFVQGRVAEARTLIKDFAGDRAPEFKAVPLIWGRMLILYAEICTADDNFGAASTALQDALDPLHGVGAQLPHDTMADYCYANASLLLRIGDGDGACEEYGRALNFAAKAGVDGNTRRWWLYGSRGYEYVRLLAACGRTEHAREAMDVVRSMMIGEGTLPQLLPQLRKWADAFEQSGNLLSWRSITMLYYALKAEAEGAPNSLDEGAVLQSIRTGAEELKDPEGFLGRLDFERRWLDSVRR